MRGLAGAALVALAIAAGVAPRLWMGGALVVLAFVALTPREAR